MFNTLKSRSFTYTKALCLLLCTFLLFGVTGCTSNSAEQDTFGIETCDKPVIYLYPTADNTEIEVCLDFKGEILALDPEYNLINGWKVTADKNGTIHYNDKTYPYLFWEGDPFFTMNFYSGFCVAGKNTEKFLQETLPKLGLNEQETKDFCEYWIPRMKDNTYNIISFQTNNYTDNAKLTITPKPDVFTRVMMAWYPSDIALNIPPQQLPESPKRTGFTVIEWGGIETIAGGARSCGY